MRDRRRALGRVALAAFAVALGLLAAEGALRVSLSPRFARAQQLVRWPDAGFGEAEPRGPIPYRLQRIRTSDAGVEIEAPSGVARFAWAAPVDRPRVVILGDSNTEAWNLPGYRAWPSFLADARPALEVVGVGVGGWNTRAEIAFLHEDLLRLETPTLVLQMSPNDAEHIVVRPRDGPAPRFVARCPLPDVVTSGPASPAGDWGAHDVLSFDCVERDFDALPFGSRIGWLLDWHLGDARASRLVAVNDAQRDSLWRLAQWSRARRARVLAVLFPVLEDRAQFEVAHQRGLLDELGLASLDLTPALREGGSLERLRRDPGDTLHPNDEGHRLIAEAVADALLE